MVDIGPIPAVYNFQVRVEVTKSYVADVVAASIADAERQALGSVMDDNAIAITLGGGLLRFIDSDASVTMIKRI